MPSAPGQEAIRIPPAGSGLLTGDCACRGPVTAWAMLHQTG